MSELEEKFDVEGLRSIAAAANLAEETMSKANDAIAEARANKVALDIVTQIIPTLYTKLIDAAKKGQNRIEVDLCDAYHASKNTCDDSVMTDNTELVISANSVSEFTIKTEAIQRAREILRNYAKEKGLTVIGKKEGDSLYLSFEKDRYSEALVQK